jgi:SPP1 gp7 family putative phage head morphogenesis protein
LYIFVLSPLFEKWPITIDGKPDRKDGILSRSLTRARSVVSRYTKRSVEAPEVVNVSESSIRRQIDYARRVVAQFVQDMPPRATERAGNGVVRHLARQMQRVLGSKARATSSQSQALVDEFVRRNVALIEHANLRSLSGKPTDLAIQLQEVIIDSYQRGEPLVDLEYRIQNLLNISENRAKLIASDQIGKLNSYLTEHTMRENGIEWSIWWTKLDNLVRPSHRDVHGLLFRWDRLPIVDGEQTAPGRPIKCRCIAVPAPGIRNPDNDYVAVT